MKKFICFILTLTVLLFSACKKNSNDNNTGWSDEDKTSYKNVMTLQKQASANYATWSQSMDSLEAINKLAQFFRDDPLVSSATIGSQGITVMFKNGMGGGIFLNPEDEPGNGKLKCGSFTNEGHVPLNNKSIVNKKDMILLNPTYWERSEYIDPLVVNYEKNLPKVGMRLAKTYFNEWADMEQFIKLSGYGIIQIYTHGWAWPDNREISDIYIQTGEVENEETSNIYWKEIRTKDVLIAEAGTAYGREFVYLLSQKFLADHNDFSQDTILFNGSFCYSGLGNWPNLQKSFAAGTYIGIDWSVRTDWNSTWARDLVGCLTDTLVSIPVTTSTWLSLWAPPNPPKQYYNEEAGKYVSLKIYGDSSLALWGGVKDIDGNVYHTVTIGSQVWMVENLKTSRLNDGTHIPCSFTDDEWKNLTTAAACYYDFSSANFKAYGYLYNFHAVNSGKLAPIGWHIPTKAEWDKLINYLGGPEIAGTALKERGTVHWNEYNVENATNSSGFTARGGGLRYHECGLLKTQGSFWSTTEFDGGSVWFLQLLSGDAKAWMNIIEPHCGLSVRCVKD